jgi:hypothetical protein
MYEQRFDRQFVASKQLFTDLPSICRQVDVAGPPNRDPFRETLVMRKGLTLATLLALGACAQVPMADPQADQEGRRFDPPAPGKGALYIYRSGLMGLTRPIGVAIAGGASAQLASNTYLRLEGPPGPIEIDCKIGDQTGGNQIQIADGQIQYVEVSIKVGVLLPACEVAEVSPRQGQAAVQNSKRVTPQ